MNLQDLVGKVVSSISESEIKTECGLSLTLYHSQDCCEQVCVDSTFGDEKLLVGNVIEEISLDVLYEDELKDMYGQSYFDKVMNNVYDSYTITEFSITAGGSTYKEIWIGQSNGYYSERVDFEIK